MSARLDFILKYPYSELDAWQDSISCFDCSWMRGNYLNAPKSSNSFNLFMNVKQFKPAEIEIKLVDRFIVVEAKREDKSNANNSICRDIKRQYKLPDDIDPSTLNSTVNSKGLLVVKTSKKTSEATGDNEVVIPVKIMPSIDGT